MKGGEEPAQLSLSVFLQELLHFSQPRPHPGNCCDNEQDSQENHVCKLSVPGEAQHLMGTPSMLRIVMVRRVVGGARWA